MFSKHYSENKKRELTVLYFRLHCVHFYDIELYLNELYRYSDFNVIH